MKSFASAALAGGALSIARTTALVVVVLHPFTRHFSAFFVEKNNVAAGSTSKEARPPATLPLARYRAEKEDAIDVPGSTRRQQGLLAAAMSLNGAAGARSAH